MIPCHVSLRFLGRAHRCAGRRNVDIDPVTGCHANLLLAFRGRIGEDSGRISDWISGRKEQTRSVAVSGSSASSRRGLSLLPDPAFLKKTHGNDLSSLINNLNPCFGGATGR